MARPGLIHLLSYRDSWYWESTRRYDGFWVIMKYEHTYWKRSAPIIRSGKIELIRNHPIPGFDIEFNEQKIVVRGDLYTDDYLVTHNNHRLLMDTVAMLTYVYGQVRSRLV